MWAISVNGTLGIVASYTRVLQKVRQQHHVAQVGGPGPDWRPQSNSHAFGPVREHLAGKPRAADGDVQRAVY
jgi:hypothetical protein